MTLRPFIKNPTVQRILEVTIKVGIFILLIWAIYKQVFEHKNADEIVTALETSLSPHAAGLLSLILGLMCINWILEAVKWFYLIREVEEIKFGRAVMAIFAGVTLTLFTPNRIGEYGGRFIFLKDPLNGKALMATFLGSIAQIVVTLAMGMIGVYVVLDDPELIGARAPGWMEAGLFTGLLILLLFYYRADLFQRMIARISQLKRLEKWLSVLTQYSKAVLTGILSISLLRFAIYSFQYLLLLHLFGVDVLSWYGFFSVAAIFLIQTVIPSIAVLELGIRGNVALLILSGFSGSEVGIIAAAFSLWFINLVIPSTIGYCFILAERIFKP